MKVLVTGWFSFELMGASAGDLLARDLVCQWLTDFDLEFDIATAKPFDGGVNVTTVSPLDYWAVIFVCGPFGNGPPITEFLTRFSGVPLVGLNLTMLDSLDEWNPFDLLLERDSTREARPDIVFMTQEQNVPVAGLILVHPQNEYGDRVRHDQANAAINQLIAGKEVAVIRVDTRLDANDTGFRTAREIESVIRKMDTVLTTRLHGMVLSIKNGVPPLVVDPIADGAKISRQAEAIGWPIIFTADELDQNRLCDAYDFCLSDEARSLVGSVRQSARRLLENLPEEFRSGLRELIKEWD